MRIPHLLFLPALLFLAAATAFGANTAPTPVILRAEMRPGTTYMDIEYRVDDPDDATVRVRALAFVNGTRSFANILRPVTFVEGTAGNLGDSIRSGTKQTLTWNVAADWNIDLGQVKFEILALDSRGLLPIDWITIPAANGQPALTISKDAPSDAAVLNALFWLYADNDPGLSLANGILSGNFLNGIPLPTQLASGSTVGSYGRLFCFKRMNLDDALDAEVAYASTTARAALLSTTKWHAVNRPWAGTTVIVAWGTNTSGQTNVPVTPDGFLTIAVGSCAPNALALKSDGTIVAWGDNTNGQCSIPPGLTGVTAIAAGGHHSLSLKADHTVAAWGQAIFGQCAVPADLSGVAVIAAGDIHSLALRSDGTVLGWGSNNNGRSTPPTGLSGVTAIAAGSSHSLALRSDSTVVGWGNTTIPAGLSAAAIAAGSEHSLALKSDGTVVGWGSNGSGQTTIPTVLSGVTAIAAGGNRSLALKRDGTVVAWGLNTSGQCTVPAGLSGVTAIAAGSSHSLALKAKAL